MNRLTPPEILANIIVPLLMPSGDEKSCNTATIDKFGPTLAATFIRKLEQAGWSIVSAAEANRLADELAEANQKLDQEHQHTVLAHQERDRLTDERNKARTELSRLAAELAEAKTRIERLELSNSVFEKNSEDATKDWEKVQQQREIIRKLLPLVKMLRNLQRNRKLSDGDEATIAAAEAAVADPRASGNYQEV